MNKVLFFDEAKIYVKAGDGGNGAIAFRREKYVPHGGPSGGNGGRGGHVFLRVSVHLNTLVPFRRRRHFRADRGKHGSGSTRHGRSGEDLFVDVPPGTVVRDANTGEFIADLTTPGQTVCVARGGRGGRGNAVFASPTNQAPRIAERGEPGEERWLTLELKLIADVGLIGMPNAGKSTLVSVVSAARPKIADYPFTTLQPHLGVVELDDYRTFVLADIPGLIPGAHEGKGLGDQFLRHVERCRLLIHLLDGASADPLADYEAINGELAATSRSLAEKPQVVVLNKMDLPQARSVWPSVRKAIADKGLPVMAISALTHQGVSDMVKQLATILDSLPTTAPEETEVKVFRPAEAEPDFSISREEDGTWVVTGRRVERLMAITRWDEYEAVQHLQRQLRALGLHEALEKEGITFGDTVRIGDAELEWT
jgi:GTP-binding protein